MIIKGKTTVRINEWEYNVDVKFLVPLQKMEIVIPITSTKSLEVGDFLYARRFKEIVIVNEMGQEFTAYECIFYERITKIDTITILGQYKTLIKGRSIPTSGKISFHFEGLDCLVSTLISQILKFSKRRTTGVCLVIMRQLKLSLK